MQYSDLFLHKGIVQIIFSYYLLFFFFLLSNTSWFTDVSDKERTKGEGSQVWKLQDQSLQLGLVIPLGHLNLHSPWLIYFIFTNKPQLFSAWITCKPQVLKQENIFLSTLLGQTIH